MDIQDQLKNKLSVENLKPKSTKKKVLLGVIIILLGALGLELGGKDFDLGSIFSGNSISDSTIERDSEGNLIQNEDGDFVTKVMRDKTGNVVTDGSGKAEDKYNCADFSTQTEAQTFFDNAGGVENDINRLDGNKDGVPCESLPKGE